ncbi:MULTISPECIES: sigma-70 family RNA polymerase sigma factor [Myxococcus]|uniref:Sigma-70 family RNA polymerase sigma factor n=1 Tax=Myxococcus llanfairpwllgwyngyllgogerychwyrndrobwllllantysiliogogogochensis TaxID=2590453 RepID=A0A540X522_9BACT|nr:MULTISPECIES: sigma-70 family RNA polymerase sigma factor [Myxococcus]NTX03027.1 sigma-70 family RNA polymerase sigma factor [Myxococcus sp. CA040A]NTX11446.1 sigma-70 family RNA polymerase sigma factor [Myxococcus sp. CA056]NTX34456.1 sigma-70 family RNA polymerase sigma factor [Myxococcus sp. CA033]NTX51597.1 sigma-70 family RNA polymerase sigma factor [Myxococcus sp. CA039A]TQF16319.1 sigma-70 family RNA polymerase sigma factor [Myxococcus llanfairpwllgwyngyllgogerychwyrndrobwllllantysil
MAKTPDTEVHEEDLALARACAHGDTVALAALEARIIPQVRVALKRRGVDETTTDEALQVFRARFLVADGAMPPRIMEYSGRGPLSAWLRMTVLRLAWGLVNERKGPALPDDTPLEALSAAPHDMELQYLKSRYGADFNAAFQEALAGLEPRARTLLRMHLVDGMGTARIAEAYGVDRSSVKRWLATAREWLLDQTRTRFAARVGARVPELGSLLAQLQSQLDLSIRRLMTTEGDAP